MTADGNYNSAETSLPTDDTGEAEPLPPSPSADAESVLTGTVTSNLAADTGRMERDFAPPLAESAESHARVVRDITPKLSALAEVESQARMVRNAASASASLSAVAAAQAELVRNSTPNIYSSASMGLSAISAARSELIRNAATPNMYSNASSSLSALTATYADLVRNSTPNNYLNASAKFSALAEAQARLVRNASPNISALAAAQTQASMGLASSRFHLLEQGFNGDSATAADAFGRLQRAINTSPKLAKASVAAIQSTQAHGSFGPDVSAIQTRAAALADALESEDASEVVARPLAELQDVTDLADELLINFSEELGLWQVLKNKKHRVSTAGILLGFTMGLMDFVFTAGIGVPMHQSLYTSVGVGGGIYFAVQKWQKSDGS